MINIKAIRDTEIVRDYFFSNFASLPIMSVLSMMIK